MKKIIVLTLAFISFNAQAAFKSGEKFVCLDSVVKGKVKIKIVSISKKKAYVLFDDKKSKRYYPSKQVVMKRLKSGGIALEMKSKKGKVVEGVSIFNNKKDGVYYSTKTSRMIKCKELK